MLQAMCPVVRKIQQEESRQESDGEWQPVAIEQAEIQGCGFGPHAAPLRKPRQQVIIVVCRKGRRRCGAQVANQLFGALKVSPWWLVGSYFFQTVGELSLSPVGLSSMTKLSPRRYVGQMMGIWFLASALGNLIAGLLGGNVDPSKLEQTPQLFTITTVSLLVSAVVLALLVVPIRKMMGEAKH